MKVMIYRVTPLAGVEIQILMSLLLLWLWVVVVMEVLVVVVGGGGGGGHGGDGGGGHFQMANVDYPPNSEPITRKKNMGASRSHMYDGTVSSTLCGVAHRNMRRSAKRYFPTPAQLLRVMFVTERRPCSSLRFARVRLRQRIAFPH